MHYFGEGTSLFLCFQLISIVCPISIDVHCTYMYVALRSMFLGWTINESNKFSYKDLFFLLVLGRPKSFFRFIRK